MDRREASRGVMLSFAVLLLVVAGCSSTAPRTARSANVVDVTLRDFRISVSRTRVPSGDVAFSVANVGPVNHEFILVRSATSALPMRADGITIDEDALARSTVATLEPGPPGKTRTLSTTLTPGRYEMFCNMAGHFLGGMHAELTVS